MKTIGETKCPSSKCGNQPVLVVVEDDDENLSAPFIANHCERDGNALCEAGELPVDLDKIKPISSELSELANKTVIGSQLWL